MPFGMIIEISLPLGARSGPEAARLGEWER